MSYRSCPIRPLICCVSLVLLVFVQSQAAQGQGRRGFEEARSRMVLKEIIGEGVTNERVIESMRQTPRHEFVPLAQRGQAYFDMSLPIGDGQTISSPFVVAYMTEQLDPQPTDRVLEIGTGSGYQAAVLSSLVDEVYSIEIVEPLGRRAMSTVKRLGYRNVHIKTGDGYAGWPRYAPFDKIIVTCSPEKIPRPLVEQLREGGRMVVPAGERYRQTIYLLRKKDGKLEAEALLPTVFVPMTGEAERRRQIQPDPRKPSLHNADFEKSIGDPPGPEGWHYFRQGELVEDVKAPMGTHYVRFSNEQAGRVCRALQAFPVDGRYVRQLDVSLWVRAEEVRPGRDSHQLPAFGIIYYDENRREVGESKIGPWRASFDWQQQRGRLEVPPRAREAIVFMGLLGATGEFCVDDVRLGGVGLKQR